MADNPDVDDAIEELTAGTSVDVASISAIALDTTRFTPAESVEVLEGVIAYCSDWASTIRGEIRKGGDAEPPIWMPTPRSERSAPGGEHAYRSIEGNPKPPGSPRT